MFEAGDACSNEHATTRTGATYCDGDRGATHGNAQPRPADAHHHADANANTQADPHAYRPPCSTGIPSHGLRH